MEYDIKWIETNLGISRKTINRYMVEKFIKDKRKQGKLIKFSKDEVKAIWYIKTFIGMGYTTKDIDEMIKQIKKNEGFDFIGTISSKIEKLEEKIKWDIQSLELAKTIKLTGRIPTIKEVETMKYENFIKHIRENYNFVSDDGFSELLKRAEKSINNYNDNSIKNVIETITPEYHFMMDYEAFYRILKEMKDLDYKSEVVQTIVNKFYEFFCKYADKLGFEGKATKTIFAAYLNPYYFDDGDMKIMNEKKYGKDGCEFISRALKYFAVEDLRKKYISDDQSNI